MERGRGRAGILLVTSLFPPRRAGAQVATSLGVVLVCPQGGQWVRASSTQTCPQILVATGSPLAGAGEAALVFCWGRNGETICAGGFILLLRRRSRSRGKVVSYGFTTGFWQLRLAAADKRGGCSPVLCPAVPSGCS